MAAIHIYLSTQPGIRKIMPDVGKHGIARLALNVCTLADIQVSNFEYTRHTKSRIALRDYEQRVSRYSAQLLSVIAENIGQPTDMARWFNYYSFDVIGDLTFGKSFDMLITGKDAYMLKSLHSDMQTIVPFVHSIWILPLFKKIPILNHSYITYFRWLREQIENRIKVNCALSSLDFAVEDTFPTDIIVLIERTWETRHLHPAC